VVIQLLLDEWIWGLGWDDGLTVVKKVIQLSYDGHSIVVWELGLREMGVVVIQWSFVD
jgi:hypothetical protein